VLADRRWGGSSAVLLFSVAALVGGLMAATAAAHAGQVVLEGFVLSERQAATAPWSYVGRVVPMAWAVALVIAAGATHGRVIIVGCSLLVAVRPSTLYSDAKVANRKGLARGGRNWPLNDGQIIPNFRGVRVALGTGYNPGKSAGFAKRPRERSPARNPNVTIRNVFNVLRRRACPHPAWCAWKRDEAGAFRSSSVQFGQIQRRPTCVARLVERRGGSLQIVLRAIRADPTPTHLLLGGMYGV
jgi:hypothetical protein